MSKEKQISIAVIGGSDPSSRETRIAREVGRELAERGAILVCGGLGGVMAAACQGARSADGITVGILPGTDPADANPHVQIPIATGVGYARNMAVVKSARAVIAIGGSYGTLSEIAYALQSDIPVVGIDTWSLARSGHPDGAILPAADAAEAVRLALDLSTALGGNSATGK
ncbi:MAG: TIGR00725 family protein [Dehalococcoidales bacterium]